MDGSQSSDVFSISEEFNYENHSKAMDTVTYESLLASTKIGLSRNITKEFVGPTFFSNFSGLLSDCESCVSQSLSLVVAVLNADEFELDKLCEYLEDAVSLLQLLSGFIKNVVESISMSCCTMKTFPTTTGRIIMMVYSHCRDSESLYGSYLKAIEKQLKDFFRSCHELQLTYLMVLEKHFTFDFSETDEFDVLIEVLDINLKIGEIVQSLDVKTMAEHWKAYIMICEKYSHFLTDKNIFYNCTKLLCTMTESNVKNAVEEQAEEKLILRSLKVASFTLKILLKIIIIFKHATVKEYGHIVDLLICLNAYQETASDKSLQMRNLLNSNISVPIEAVIREIAKNEQFINILESKPIDKLEKKNQLGYISLVISVMKAILQNNDQIKTNNKKIVLAVFKFLPYGHIWFNIGLKYSVLTPTKDIQTYGLYEHLLTHTLALSMTLNAEEIISLEEKMYKALLGTDSMSALFASNLWILLARLCPQQYVLSQVISLCKIYQKLDKNSLFTRSPQNVHLSFTMNKLFETLNEQSRMKVYNYFNFNEERNTNIWTVLKISNLPTTIICSSQEMVFEKTKIGLNSLFLGNFHSADDVKRVIVTMKLASTCEGVLEETVIKAWSRLCCKNRQFILSKGLNKKTMWFLDLMEALIALTKDEILNESYDVVKVLHVISNITENDITELKLLLVDLVFKISTLEIHEEHRNFVENFLKQIFTNLLKKSDKIVTNRVFNALRIHTVKRNIESIVNEIINSDVELEEIWNRLKNNSSKKDNTDVLWITFNYKFGHKCVKNDEYDNEEIVISDSSASAVDRTPSNNFDFVDFDTLFENEDEKEPASKKVKLNISKVEEIISRLEADAVLLSNMKENVGAQEKCRIRYICEQLRNIVE